MSLQSIIYSTIVYLSSLSKKKLLEIIKHLRKSYLSLEKENKALRSEIALLKKTEKLKSVNEQSNKPSSKQADWEAKGVGNDQKGKKKGRGKQGRKGAGNQIKNQQVSQIETVSVEVCFNCGADLSNQAPLKSSNIRLFEDIVRLPLKTEVVKLVQEKKYCRICKKVITASNSRFKISLFD